MKDLPQFLNCPGGVKGHFFRVVFFNDIGEEIAAFRSDDLNNAVNAIQPIVKERTVTLRGSMGSTTVEFTPTKEFNGVFSRVEIRVQKDDEYVSKAGGPVQNVIDTETFGVRDDARIINYASKEIASLGVTAFSLLNYETGLKSSFAAPWSGVSSQIYIIPVANKNTNSYFIPNRGINDSYIFNRNNNTFVQTALSVQGQNLFTQAVGDYFYAFRAVDSQNLVCYKIDALTALTVTTTSFGSTVDFDCSRPAYKESTGEIFIYCQINGLGGTLISYDTNTDSFSTVVSGQGGISANANLIYDETRDLLILMDDGTVRKYDFNTSTYSIVTTSDGPDDGFQAYYDKNLGWAMWISEAENFNAYDIPTSTSIFSHNLGQFEDYIRGPVYRPGTDEILLFDRYRKIYAVDVNAPYGMSQYANGPTETQDAFGGWGTGLCSTVADTGFIALCPGEEAGNFAVFSYTTPWAPTLKNQLVYEGELAPPINRTYEGHHSASLRTYIIEKEIDGTLSRASNSAVEHVRWLLEQLDGVIVDQGSFNEASALDNTTITLNAETGSYSDLIEDLCWLGRFAIYFDGYTAKAVFLARSPVAVREISLKDAIDIRHTAKAETEVYTTVSVTDSDSNTVNFKRNDVTWGDRSFAFESKQNAVFTPEVTVAANYWLYQYGVMWKRLELLLPWRFMNLEPYDTVLVSDYDEYQADTFVQRVYFNEYYAGFFGDAEQVPLDNFTVVIKPQPFLEDYAGIAYYKAGYGIRLVNPIDNGFWKIQLWEQMTTGYNIWESTTAVIPENEISSISVNTTANTISLNGSPITLTQISVGTGSRNLLTGSTVEYYVLGRGSKLPEESNVNSTHQYVGFIDTFTYISGSITLDSVSSSAYTYWNTIGRLSLGNLASTGIGSFYARVLRNTNNMDGTVNLLLETDIDVLTGLPDDRYWNGAGDASNIILISQDEITPAGTHRFVWKATVDVFTKYEIDIEQDAAPYYNNNTLTALSVDVALPTGVNHTYTWKVRGFIPDGAGGGDWAPWSFPSQLRYVDDGALFGGFDPVIWEANGYSASWGPEYDREGSRTASFTALVELEEMQIKNGETVANVTPENYYPATYRRLLGGDNLTYFVRGRFPSGVWGGWTESTEYVPHPGAPSSPSITESSWTDALVNFTINIPNYASTLEMRYRTRKTWGYKGGYILRYFILTGEEPNIKQELFVGYYDLIPESLAEVEVQLKAKNIRGESEWTTVYLKNNDASLTSNTSTDGDSGAIITDSTISNVPDDIIESPTTGSPTSGASFYDGSLNSDKQQNTSPTSGTPETDPGDTQEFNFTEGSVNGTQRFGLDAPTNAVYYWSAWVWGTGGDANTAVGGEEYGPLKFGYVNGVGRVIFDLPWIDIAGKANDVGASNLASYYEANNKTYPSDFNFGVGFMGLALGPWPSAVRLYKSIGRFQFYDANGDKIGSYIQKLAVLSTFTPEPNDYPYSLGRFWVDYADPNWVFGPGPEVPPTYPGL